MSRGEKRETVGDAEAPVPLLARLATGLSGIAAAGVGSIGGLVVGGAFAAWVLRPIFRFLGLYDADRFWMVGVGSVLVGWLIGTMLSVRFARRMQARDRRLANEIPAVSLQLGAISGPETSFAVPRGAGEASRIAVKSHASPPRS